MGGGPRAVAVYAVTEMGDSQLSGRYRADAGVGVGVMMGLYFGPAVWDDRDRSG